LQSSAPDGCVQSRIAVYRPDASGRWSAIWDTSAPVNGGPPLLAPATKTDAGCFPALGLFTVQPQDGSGAPSLVFFASDADGSEHAVAQALADPANTPPAVLQAAPGLQVSLGAGTPLTVVVTGTLYAPDAVGFPELKGQQIGREEELLHWQPGGFQPAEQTVSLNCLSGTVLGVRPLGSGFVLAVRCPDGSAGAYTAVALSAATQLPGGLSSPALQPNDDVTISLQAAAPGASASGLPIAAQVSSQSAGARLATPAVSLRAPVPTAPPAATPPRSAAPARPAVSQPQRAAVATLESAAPATAAVASNAAAAQSAPLQPSAPSAAPDTVTAPGRPIPLQPEPAATARPLPSQPAGR
jgi:hypothetical protein